MSDEKPKSYSEKLLDPRWQKRRFDIFTRANWKCENCGDADRTLQIHHTSYVKEFEPWEYPDDKLRCLCDFCHWQTELCISSLREAVKDIPWELLQGLVKEIHLANADHGPRNVAYAMLEFLPTIRTKGQHQ